MKKFILAVFLLSLLIPSLLEAGQVRGYFRRDGTYVQLHQRSNPDGNPYNNYNFPGNYNPNTGQITPGNPDSYLDHYYRNRNRSGSGGFGNYDYLDRYQNKDRSGSGGYGSYDWLNPYGQKR